MKNNNELDAYQYITDSIVDAIAEITKILTATKVETLNSTIQDMTVTIPSMVNIPAKTNLEALHNTIKNMATKNKVEAVQHTIEHLASTTKDITSILPVTEVVHLQKSLENSSASIITITKIFSEIDWDDFEPTDKDVRKARDILNSENIEQAVLENFREKKTEGELTSAHKTVVLDLMLLYHTLIFISETTTLARLESRISE